MSLVILVEGSKLLTPRVTAFSETELAVHCLETPFLTAAFQAQAVFWEKLIGYLI